MPRRKGKQVDLICAMCGYFWSAPPGRAARMRFCSRECADEAKYAVGWWSRVISWMDTRGTLYRVDPEIGVPPDPDDQCRYRDGRWFFLRDGQWTEAQSRRGKIIYEPVESNDVPPRLPSI